MSFKVIVADDHALYREGLLSLLAAADDVSVAAQCADGTEVLESVKIHQPDLVFLDYDMPGMSGLDVLIRLQKDIPNPPKVIVLTASELPEMYAEFLDHAVPGIVRKNNSTETILEALETVRAGGTYYPPEVEAQVSRARALVALTSRERQVFRLVADGLTNPEIAEVMGVSVKTVDTHRTNLMRKLDVHSTSELIAEAFRFGLR